VTTLVVSDLHLGARTRIDLLRRGELRAPLLAALEGVERLVLLGDVLELRHGPAREALAAARGLFEALGERFGGREVVIVPGNHDHQLIAPWLERRGREEPAPPLGLEQRLAAADASPLAGRLAEWAAPARVEIAYPGLWLREEVWATHGHYLDRHTTVPAYERIGAAVVERFVRPLPDPLAAPDDYEAILAPIYALLYGAAQYVPASAGAAHNGASIRIWEQMRGGDRRRRRLRYALLAAGVPLTIAALNRAGLGPLRPELSSRALRRAGLEAIGEVVRRLGVQAQHVIFGHTHRSGPWRRDPAHDWTTPTGARLINAGTWAFEPAFLTATPNESPYWPGTCVVVEESGPPRLRRLLGGRGHAELGSTAIPA
jgi:calcineurin-like phosphoesterase family protein